ncbi:MAG: N-acetylglucosamine-6-phosphate deacetylase [Pirellulales bacterium]
MPRNHARFVDLQVNGYAGVDFNSECLTTEDLRGACLRLRLDGVEKALATIITASLDSMVKKAVRIVACCREDATIAEVIAGIHLEGPFISAVPGYVGAHPLSEVRPASLELAMRLYDACAGLLRIVTLAPENDPRAEITSWLVDRGVTVSAGHCDPSLEQLQRAISAGLSMFTHLGNGCPLQLHRHENVIQRVLSLSDELRVCFIADGIHVPWPALQNYLSIVGVDRSIVVTDATAAAGMGAGIYLLGGQEVVVDEHLATWSADRSHLVGSAVTMAQAAENLRINLRMAPDDISKLTALNPASILLATGRTNS